MSVILSATDSTDLENLPSREVLFSKTAEPFIRSFTIDLVGFNLFFVRNHSVFLVSLSGTQSREIFLRESNSPLEHISSYQNIAFSYLTTFLILTRMVLPFADVFIDQNFARFVDLGFQLTANSMFRESLQPLPGQPTDTKDTFLNKLG